ncbi:hypothetical protein QQS21_009889 [Conoideocrella luteorostrata]|uniref:Uncharacterized protein n=1 Tax=Conoideocrella luteorostrata TaxID=1105319 RepID=A0AAJ0FPX2_9HYPO|nr:hypothetical protein QQS21_009889 [Conoideocrella luteorostrata]
MVAVLLSLSNRNQTTKVLNYVGNDTAITGLTTKGTSDSKSLFDSSQNSSPGSQGSLDAGRKRTHHRTNNHQAYHKTYHYAIYEARDWTNYDARDKIYHHAYYHHQDNNQVRDKTYHPTDHYHYRQADNLAHRGYHQDYHYAIYEAHD